MKTVIGGGVLKNVKLTVFLEAKTYLELVNEARHYNINAKTDSQLIGKVIQRFLYNRDEVSALQMQVESLKKAVAEKNVTIDNFMQKPKKVKT